jgi:hypothetical protein
MVLIDEREPEVARTAEKRFLAWLQRHGGFAIRD